MVRAVQRKERIFYDLILLLKNIRMSSFLLRLFYHFDNLDITASFWLTADQSVLDA